MTNIQNHGLFELNGNKNFDFSEQTLDYGTLAPELVERFLEKGISQPTPIQAVSFHPIMAEQDLLAQSFTGSGKTLAFCLPVALKIREKPTEKHPSTLILVPTRELAEQITSVLQDLLATCRIRTATVIGGASYVFQERQLRSGCDIVVGTPGRVADLIRKGTFQLTQLRHFVLDEVDQMLDIGFAKELKFIRDSITNEVQTLFFSATLDRAAKALADKFLNDPVQVLMKQTNQKPENIEHSYILLKDQYKLDGLISALAFHQPQQAIIFCETKRECSDVSEALNRKGLNADQLNSDLAQNDRKQAMQRFRSGYSRFLVATDIAARGIDVQHLPVVINYSPPRDKNSYTHRSGRTGRAGATGQAWTLVSPRESQRYFRMIKLEKFPALEMQLPDQAAFTKVLVHAEIDKLIKKSEKNVDMASFDSSLVDETIDGLSADEAKNIIKRLIMARLNILGISDPKAFQWRQQDEGGGAYPRPRRTDGPRSGTGSGPRSGGGRPRAPYSSGSPYSAGRGGQGQGGGERGERSDRGGRGGRPSGGGSGSSSRPRRSNGPAAPRAHFYP